VAAAAETALLAPPAYLRALVPQRPIPSPAEANLDLMLSLFRPLQGRPNIIPPRAPAKVKPTNSPQRFSFGLRRPALRPTSTPGLFVSPCRGVPLDLCPIPSSLARMIARDGGGFFAVDKTVIARLRMAVLRPDPVREGYIAAHGCCGGCGAAGSFSTSAAGSGRSLPASGIGADPDPGVGPGLRQIVREAMEELV